MKYSQIELEMLKKENKALMQAISERDALIQELTDQLAVKGYIKLNHEILKRHEISLPAVVHSNAYCLA